MDLNISYGKTPDGRLLNILAALADYLGMAALPGLRLLEARVLADVFPIRAAACMNMGTGTQVAWHLAILQTARWLGIQRKGWMSADLGSHKVLDTRSSLSLWHVGYLVLLIHSRKVTEHPFSPMSLWAPLLQPVLDSESDSVLVWWWGQWGPQTWKRGSSEVTWISTWGKEAGPHHTPSCQSTSFQFSTVEGIFGDQRDRWIMTMNLQESWNGTC